VRYLQQPQREFPSASFQKKFDIRLTRVASLLSKSSSSAQTSALQHLESGRLETILSSDWIFVRFAVFRHHGDARLSLGFTK